MIKGYLKHTASFVALFGLFGLLYLAATAPEPNCESTQSHHGIPAACNVYSAPIG